MKSRRIFKKRGTKKSYRNKKSRKIMKGCSIQGCYKHKKMNFRCKTCMRKGNSQYGGQTNLGFLDNTSNIFSGYVDSLANTLNAGIYAAPPVTPSNPLLGHFNNKYASV
jgi:hypothetical protein